MIQGTGKHFWHLTIMTIDILESGDPMQTSRPSATLRLTVLIAAVALAFCGTLPLTSMAQDKTNQAKQADPHSQHKVQTPRGTQQHDMSKMGAPKHDMSSMSGQKQTGWWFEKYNQGQKPGMAGMQGMTTDQADAGSLASDGTGSGMPLMNADLDLMGMKSDTPNMMGHGAVEAAESTNLKRMSGMKIASARPSNPGVSHLYHIGATGMFLNHMEHIALTTQQQSALNGIKQKSLLSKATVQRKIDEAEQELWELTAADDPDMALIQATVQRLETLRSGQRMGFIRSVAEAAKVLTDDQREVLLGISESATTRSDVPADK